MKYDVIIGLEIHAELKTKSKMFCWCPLRHSSSLPCRSSGEAGEASDNDAPGQEPNTTVCPICLAHPGTLPVPNQQAIEWTILLGLALNCRINKLSKFDRKNYFYPDLPKGYQISQYDLPVAYDGFLEVDGSPILITRVHLEEDTGKLIHPVSKISNGVNPAGKAYSLVDYNRAGTPLVELVTEPVIKDAATAKKFAQSYQQILRFLNISNADMEKGEMRCEANISLQEPGKWKYANSQIKPIGDYKLNPKVELKNINSFKYMEKAVDYEIKRQTKALESGEKLIQETRGWNNEKGITFSQRVKETSADYRYFPEPDIPPLKISQAWIDKIKAKMGELPAQKIKRFREEYFFSDYESEILAGDKALADYTEKVISELRAWIEASGDNWERQKHKLAKAAANWLTNELFKHLKADGKNIGQLKITAENFAEFIALVYQNKINSSAAQTILARMYKQGGDPTQIMADLGLEQLDDKEALEKIIAEVIFKNQKQVAEYKKGKTNVFQFFIGQIMAATKGRANPKILIEILTDLLKK